MTVKLLVTLSCGLTRSALSVLVATVVIVFVPGLWAWLGDQVMMPLVLMAAPAGGLSSA